jgi:hypothetical protein
MAHAWQINHVQLKMLTEQITALHPHPAMHSPAMNHYQWLTLP